MALGCLVVGLLGCRVADAAGLLAVEAVVAAFLAFLLVMPRGVLPACKFCSKHVSLTNQACRFNNTTCLVWFALLCFVCFAVAVLV